jgi:S-formylglutathione hydrolase FrmB
MGKTLPHGILYCDGTASTRLRLPPNRTLIDAGMVLMRQDAERMGITGHSMGGHGALTLFLKHPGLYRSVSAFAPICHPTQCPWGQKAFRGYLGDDEAAWKQHDATELIASYRGKAVTILVDQVTFPLWAGLIDLRDRLIRFSSGNSTNCDRMI